MTTGNDPYTEHLRGHLTAVLDDFSPPAAPTAAIKRKGKSIRNRRRVGIAAGLAVAIIAAALVPGLLHQPKAPSPITPPPRNPKVTVDVVGKDARRGLIAKGAIDGKPWRVTLTRQGKEICVGTSGDTPQAGCSALNSYAAGQPVTLDGVGGGAINSLYGNVGSRVTRVSIELSDGAVLSLHPVTFAGLKWIAVELPVKLAIARAVAYSRTGELAYAIPFAAARGGLPGFGAWLRPGEPVPPRFVRLIGSGVSAGKRWSVALHAGPWGQCVVAAIPGDSGNTGCWATSTPQAGLVMGSGDQSKVPWWLVASAPPNVSYIVLTMTDGSTRRVPVIQIGRTHFYTIVILSGPQIARWAAYDSSGHRRYGGHGNPTFGHN